MSKTPDGGDWIAQISLKAPDGALVNLRARTDEEMGVALQIVETALDSGVVKAIAARLNPPRATAPSGNGGVKTNAPRPTANVPDAGAMQVGEFWVVTVGVDKVFPKKDTGRTREGRDGETSAVYKPGTVYGLNGKKYDSFETEDLDVAAEAQRTRQRVNIMYKETQNGEYTNRLIKKGGITIHGVVQEDAPVSANADGF